MEGFLFLYLMIAPVVFLFILYFLIRGAVRGGIGDAEADRRWRRHRGGPSGPGRPEPPAA